MGMCKPSGGIQNVIGRLGSLARWGKPNTRYDLRNHKGELIQQRWYGPDGWVLWNRDYKHPDITKTLKFPHDHKWDMDDKNGPQRGEDHLDTNLDFC
jgi:hypothetical protein